MSEEPGKEPDRFQEEAHAAAKGRRGGEYACCAFGCLMMLVSFMVCFPIGYMVFGYVEAGFTLAEPLALLVSAALGLIAMAFCRRSRDK